MNSNFVPVFDMLSDGILLQNRLKMTPVTSFVGMMSQRDQGCYRVLQAIFQQHQILDTSLHV